MLSHGNVCIAVFFVGPPPQGPRSGSRWTETGINALYQTFFAFKAWRVNDRNALIGIVLAIAVLFTFGAGLAMCVTLAIHNADPYDQLWAAMYYVGWSASVCSLAPSTALIALQISRRCHRRRHVRTRSRDSLLTPPASRLCSASASCAPMSGASPARPTRSSDASWPTRSPAQA